MAISNNLTNQPSSQAIELALIGGDLSKLTVEQRLSYYKKTCESLGLNELTKPFEYITMNGKMVLYAKRDATDQLRKLQNVSIKITSRERIDDVFQVTAMATTPDGRTDESIGAVTIGHLKGDALANSLMKAETKAKRRVTLSICGLGMLDETELETIPEIKNKALHAVLEPVANQPKDLSDYEHPPIMNYEDLPQAPAEPVADKSLISEAQRRRLFAISKKLGWSNDDVKQLVVEVTGQEHTAKIPWIKYQEICNKIEMYPKNFPFEREGDLK